MNYPAAKIIFLSLIIASVALEAFADVVLRRWALENRAFLLVLGLAVYFVGTIFWAVSLRYEYLSRAISVFTILNLIAITAVGVLFFKENLSTVNKIGIGLGIISLALIEI